MFISATSKKEVKEQKSFRTVEISIKGDKNGKPDITLWLNGIQNNLDSSTRKYLSELLTKAYFDFDLGAIPRLKDEFETGGLISTKHLFEEIESSQILRLMFDTVLTFELTEEDAWEFSVMIKELLSLYAPTTKINTIGFWPDSRDRELLELIALQSGGEFFIVTDDNN